MAVFKCKMCGGDLAIQGEEHICECLYCGTTQTVPYSADEKIANQFNRANQLRLTNRFDEAKSIYESILLEDNRNAEAHWGIILCKYGIEYVNDSTTGKKVPTCHRTIIAPIYNDLDYIEAINNADDMSKHQYESEAQDIALIQKGILERISTLEKYDVFICYKETDDATGERTQDSVIAQDLYYQLERKGYKTFFARKTLENKLGSDYEPFLFSALSTARVMIVMGTKPEYFESSWLKNEWSRFLEFTFDDSARILIPAYKGFSPYLLPGEFSTLQALDMDRIGFIQDLIDAIDRILQVTKKAAEVPQPNNGSLKPIVERAYLFLEDKEWEKAIQYTERALDMNPKCGDAYFCKFLASLRCNSFNTYIKTVNRTKKAYDKNGDYQKAKRFADEELKNKLVQLETAETEAIYNVATAKIKLKEYSTAMSVLNSIKGYKDSNELIKYCDSQINKQAELSSKLSDNQKKIQALEFAKSTKQSAINNYNSQLLQNNLHIQENALAVVATAIGDILLTIIFFVCASKIETTTDNATVKLTANDWLVLLSFLLATILYIVFPILWIRFKKKCLNEKGRDIVVGLSLALVVPTIGNIVAIIQCLKALKSNRNNSTDATYIANSILQLQNDILSIDSQIQQLYKDNFDIGQQLKEFN